MNNLSMVKEQYQQMTDEQLVRFAQHEAQSLTLEAFFLLKAELESRSIDISVINAMDEMRQTATAIQNHELKNSIEGEFVKNIWQQALDAKENGISNVDLFHQMVKAGITPEYTMMLINTIESKCRSALNSTETEIIIGWVFTVVGGLGLLYAITNPGMFLLYSLIFIVLGSVRLANCYSEKRKLQRIIENIENEPPPNFQDELYQ